MSILIKALRYINHITCDEAADELERQAKEIEALKATAWLGCNDCDCDFDCYAGRTRCIRLLGQAKEIEVLNVENNRLKKVIDMDELEGMAAEIEVLKDRVARYTKYAIGADVEIEALKAENLGHREAMRQALKELAHTLRENESPKTEAGVAE